jgi:flagellum-specific ATP synthase
MSQISTPEHNKVAIDVRRLLSSYTRSEDLIRVGAYQRGADAVLDKALEALPSINAVLQQKKTDLSSFDQTLAALKTLRL